jgi:hypothetical protein
MTFAARTLRIGRAVRRSDTQLRQRHLVDLTAASADAQSSPVSLPITQAEVKVIASAGFPLWEPLETLQLRNHRITLAYGDLSHQLARLTAGTDEEGGWDANWCTFATWSSRTIGTCIDRQPEHGLIHGLLKGFPAPLRRFFYGMAEDLLCRGHGAIYRTLAIGNRLVFLEIGTAVSHFLECFDTTHDGSHKPDFTTYWSDVHSFLTGLRHLDPSWLATAAPDPQTLREGMQAYFEAIAETDPKAKAELVLLGNLLLGTYEQTRVEGYLTATLSFFTTSWLHRLMRGPKPGIVAAIGRGLAAPASTVYAWFSTRFFLALELPSPGGMTELMVGKPVPSLNGSDRELDFPEVLRHIANPPLQAVLTRYDLSDRQYKRTRSHNWATFADRMNYITNLFRSRQRDPSLFQFPWTPSQEASLLEGRLPMEQADKP